ncbi:MAG: xanthine dehydrogenase family protein subunit M, partial [Mycobacteriales bacterium]
WAIVGVAAVAGRVALTNVGPAPMRAAATEAALASGSSIADAAALAAEGTSPVTDMHGDGAYRQHLTRLLTRRALTAVA